MDEGKEKYVRPVSEYAFQDAVAGVVFQKAVAVVEVEPLSPDDALDRIPLDVHPEFVPEVIPQPEIVVAGKIGESDARLCEICESRKESEIAFRHDGFVFEPEIEQVADNKQLLPVFSHEIEKLDEGALFLAVFFPGSDTKVGI
jgi:hypothetical protein